MPMVLMVSHMKQAGKPPKPFRGLWVSERPEALLLRLPGVGFSGIKEAGSLCKQKQVRRHEPPAFLQAPHCSHGRPQAAGGHGYWNMGVRGPFLATAAGSGL